MAHALRVLASESRDMRMNEAEKKAAALPPKLTVPMILFFLPVLFAIILGPAGIQVSQRGASSAIRRKTSKPISDLSKSKEKAALLTPRGFDVWYMSRKLSQKATRFGKRIAFDRPHATRFNSCFVHVVIAKPLHTFARHALGGWISR